MAVCVAGSPPTCVKGDGGGSAYCQFPRRTAAHSHVSTTMWDLAQPRLCPVAAHMCEGRRQRQRQPLSVPARPLHVLRG